MHPGPAWSPYDGAPPTTSGPLAPLYSALPNGWVGSFRIDGTPVYNMRRALIHHESVLDDPGIVEIRPDASTALAPLMRVVLVDTPDADYVRGDIVNIQAEDGQIYWPPNADPFHVLRVNRPGDIMPQTLVSLACLDILRQVATLFTRINERTPGATRTNAYNTIRKQATSLYSASLNDEWQVTIGGVTRVGYLPGQAIILGVNNYAAVTDLEEEGFIASKHRVLLYEDPVVLERLDLIVLANGDRVVVNDIVHSFQRMGVTIATLAKVDLRQPSDPVYTIS